MTLKQAYVPQRNVVPPLDIDDDELLPSEWLEESTADPNLGDRVGMISEVELPGGAGDAEAGEQQEAPIEQ